MKKLIAAIVVAVVVGFAVYLVAGPYRTLANIRAGVGARDQALLEANVDFPVLRENLKVQLKASFDKAMSSDDDASDLQRNLSAMGSEFAEKLTDRMVDALVTPAGMAKMAGRTLDLTPGTPGLKEPEKNQFLSDARVTFESPSTVYAVVPGQDGSKDATFVLTRQGLNWRLTNVLLPLEEPPAP